MGRWVAVRDVSSTSKANKMARVLRMVGIGAGSVFHEEHGICVVVRTKAKVALARVALRAYGFKLSR